MILKEKNFQSLLFHYFKKFFTIFALLFLILMLLIYFVVFKNTYGEIHSNKLKTANQVATYVESALNECERTYNALVTNNNITQFLHTDINTLDKKDYSDLVSTVKNIVLSNQLSSAFTEDIVVISQKNNIAISSLNAFPSSIERLNEFEFFKFFLQSNKPLVIKAIYDKELTGYTSNKPMYLICRRIDVSFESGYVFFQIDINKLKNSIASVMPNENMFFVYNDDIFISSDKTEDLSLNEILNIKRTLDDNNLQETTKYNNYHIFNKKIDAYDMNILIFLENSEYTQLKYLSIFIFIIMFLLFFLLSFWISYILSKNTMKPIMEIINIIDKPQNINSNIKMNQSEEIQYITRNILKSVENNEFYKEQLEKKLIELNESQQIALNNQIQPHFLFNTLETIYAVAFGLTKNENAAAKMIRMLSELLRISFRNDKKFISVKEEINHIKNYLDIQTLRYSDRFEVKWDIDETILEFSTIKLILQPLCENAIYHGIKYADFFCYIKISAKENKKNNSIVFTVENNGKTIEKEALSSLRENLQADNYSSAHIGLKNVNKRIKIAFGEKYGCDIFSDNQKTKVTVTIPKTKMN